MGLRTQQQSMPGSAVRLAESSTQRPLCTNLPDGPGMLTYSAPVAGQRLGSSEHAPSVWCRAAKRAGAMTRARAALTSIFPLREPWTLPMKTRSRWNVNTPDSPSAQAASSAMANSTVPRLSSDVVAS
jgi:hypothetical protein